MSTVDKGRRWAHAVDVWLGGLGFLTTARPWMEPGDDVTATLGDLRLSIEAKHQRALQLSAWVDQAAGNAPDGSVPVVVAHRLGKASPEDSYVILSGRAFRTLIENKCLIPQGDSPIVTIDLGH